MSYDLFICAAKLPLKKSAAWRKLEEIEQEDAATPVDSRIVALIHELIQRYPDVCTDNAVDDGGFIWATSPLLSEASQRILGLSLAWPYVEEVVPFVCGKALALGLNVFDPQTATIHRPTLSLSGIGNETLSSAETAYICHCADFHDLDLTDADFTERVKHSRYLKTGLKLLAKSKPAGCGLYGCEICRQAWQSGREWYFDEKLYFFRVPAISRQD